MSQYDLPDSVQEKIDELVEKMPLKQGIHSASQLMKTYADFVGELASLKGDTTHLAYLAYRMPATYASCRQVLERAFTGLEFSPKSVLDIGAGPGTGLLSLFSQFSHIEKAHLVERDVHFEKFGKALLDVYLASSENLRPKIEWHQQDILKNSVMQTQEPFDLAIASYSLGEMGISGIAQILTSVWNVTSHFLVIIEPGTPKGYETIMQVRDFLITLGGTVIAPCPHNLSCPVRGKDWCHFSARLSRSKIHRKIKQGTLGFEDEKYSYIVVSKFPIDVVKGARIIREPLRRSGHVHFSLCFPESKIGQMIFSRKHKERYSEAKDLEWGDLISQSMLSPDENATQQ